MNTMQTLQHRPNKALHPTAYSSVRSSLRFRRRVSLSLGCGARLDVRPKGNQTKNMTIVYQCVECEYEFIAGSSHWLPDEGEAHFCGSILVCEQCCTKHKIDHSLASQVLYPDRLYAEIDNIWAEYDIPASARVENNDLPKLSQYEYERCAHNTKLTEIACAKCHEMNTLYQRWHERLCPKCKNGKLEYIRSWT